MFTCYLTPEEFFASRDAKQWFPADVEQKLRNAAIIVSDDLRRRGVDPSRLMPATQLVGTDLYERVTKSSFTGDAVACSAASRVVVEVDSEEFCTFYLEGSKDETIWRRIRSTITPDALRIEVSGAGTFSQRFAEQYPYYRLVMTSDDDIIFTAYLVDDSATRLIEFKAIEEAMFLVLDLDTRTQQLYDASREQYSRLIESIKAAYDSDGDGTPDTEISLQRRPLMYR